MKTAILSDIHSNLEALDKALTVCRERKVNRIVCLGDVIGYGADPGPCLKAVVENCEFVVAGNHERALFDDALLARFSPHAAKAIAWTRERLNQEELDQTAGWPLERIEERVTWVHGTPQEPEEFHYLLSLATGLEGLRAFKTPLCFVGHTHLPQVLVESRRALYHFKEGKLRLEPEERYLINVGSVGQPRDRDPRLSVMILNEDKWELEHVRVPYDAERAAEKIRASEGLPSFLGDRLLEGV